MQYRIDTQEDLELINRAIDVISKNFTTDLSTIRTIARGNKKKADWIRYYLIDLGVLTYHPMDPKAFHVTAEAVKLRDMDYFGDVYKKCLKEQAEEELKAKKERLQIRNLRVQLIVPWLALIVSIISLVFSLLK